MRITTALLLASLTATARFAAADEAPKQEPAAVSEAKPWSATADATFSSKYVWRGISVNNEPVVQPSIAGSAYGLTLAVWGNLDLTDYGDAAGELTEVDFTLGYGYNFGPVSATVGAIYYLFPMGDLPSLATTELYAGVTAAVFLSPTLTLYQDIDDTDGLYALVSASYSFADLWKPADAVTMGATLAAGIGAGTNKNNLVYYGVDQGALTDAYITLGLPFAIGAHAVLKPFVSAGVLLNTDARDATDTPDNVWGGLSATGSL